MTYDKLQIKYGAKELTSIYNGGCTNNPDICFVFMNPTGRNIASDPNWKGRRSPWIGKCTQVYARVLPNSVYTQYLDLLCKEIEIIKPKIIVTLGNQVSSIVLNRNVSVSQCRKQNFSKNIAGKEYKVYPVYYPIGNGMMNIEKAIEDIKFIIETNKKRGG